MVEAIHLGEDKWYRSEEAEQYCEVEGHVYCKRDNDWFCEQHVDRPENHHCNCVFEECDASWCWCWWKWCSPGFSSFLKDDLLVCFLCEQGEDEGK